MIRSYDIIVYAKPIPWHRSGQTRAGGHFKRKEDEVAQFQIRAAWMTDHANLGILTGPLRMAVTAFLPAPVSLSKKKRATYPLPTGVPDTDNLLKQVKDGLEGYAYRNDNQIVTVLGRKRYALDPEGRDTPPRWVITIEEIVEGVDEDEGQFAGIWGSGEPDRHRPLDDQPWPGINVVYVD